jgi:hypothetical protein
MANKKVPTASGVISSTGTQLGLFKIVEYIAGVFDVKFNDAYYPGTTTLPSETILHCFGLVDRYVNGDGSVIPLMYSQGGGTLTDPVDLMPTDRWAGYMFFDRWEPIEYAVPKDYTQLRGFVTETAKVNIIFFFNMKLQQYYSKWGSDYRIQKEALRERILKVLTTESPNKMCEFTVMSCVDTNVEEVFKGYTVTDMKQMASLQPYYALKFECEISYRQNCTV